MAGEDQNIESIRQMVKSEDFQTLLKILSLKIREIDTVRNINTDKASMQSIAISQAGKKIAIDTIESWLSEVLNIINFEEFTNTHIEERDDIIKRIQDQKNK